MMRIVICARLFATEADRMRSEAFLNDLLEVMARESEREIRGALEQGISIPWLYDSGIVYEREPPGKEDWQSYREMLEKAPDGTGKNCGKRVGDCEDLACARAGELRVRKGVAARPRLKSKRHGDFVLYHIVVEWPDGSIEDPSRILGM